MDDVPLAYHITFGTYGTRLHGDERGMVDRRQNQPGDPIIGRNDEWQRYERTLLNYDPVFLHHDQRRFAEDVISEICVRGGWRHHIAAAQPDHTHVLLTSERDGEAVRKWLKRWLTDELSAKWPCPAGNTWWSSGGSVKWVWTQRYYENVYAYIAEQRLTAFEV